MHLHILGICGTFMGGVAVLARQAGHRVSGSDENVFPPMSTQLESLGVPLTEGYAAAAMSPPPDVVVVGNVMSRGSPVIEHLLDSGIAYTSGPQWLADNVLHDRHVLAVAGTHGKTTTASMLAWILDHAGLEPGFLIGGVPVDFGVSARIGQSPYFVVEADEYDTAFFDKRSKFVHYRPRTLVLTSLEYDHADIFPDLASIRRQFHHLIRTVPGTGRLIVHGDSQQLDTLLGMGCWTPVERYGAADDVWSVDDEDGMLTVRRDADPPLFARDHFAWPGRHYRDNALAACAAAYAVGVPLERSLAALTVWRGVRRRLEKTGVARDVTVYDDFAHHPTAIRATLQAMREQDDSSGRLVAVVEPRSNTMKLGVHADALPASVAAADLVYFFRPPGLEWDLDVAAASGGAAVRVVSDLDALCDELVVELRAGDRVVVMSNGAFGGLPRRLLDALRGAD